MNLLREDCIHMTTATLLSLAILATVSPSFAQQNIAVTGDAEIKVAPDRVVIALGVEARATTLSDARRENDTRTRNVLAAAKQLGIATDDIQTDFIQVGIQYKQDGVTPEYYDTRKSILLLLHDASKMEATLFAALDAGATHVHGVTFETTRLREYRDKARAMAVEAAEEKARDLAAAAGMKVGAKAVSITSANYGGGSWYGSGWAASRGFSQSQNVFVEGGNSTSQGTVALGRISVTASVAMTFRIE